MLFFILIHSAFACDLITSFTKCTNNTRAAVITCEGIPPSIHSNLPCDFTCPPGQRLHLDPFSSTLTCSICPSGTYSIGGGHEFNSWNSFPEGFFPRCWIMSTHGWELNTECTSWHSSSDSLLVSGTGKTDSWYKTQMTFYPVLVKDGFIEVYYRKETGKINGIEIGDFYIIIDEVLAYYDFTYNDPNWKFAKVDLGIGMHKVEISFDKFVSNHTCEVQIKSIQIRGSEFSDFECRECEDGHSGVGSDKCLYCEVGSYLDVAFGICRECPDGKTSKPGSIGADSCFAPLTCDSSAWHYYFSDCNSGRQEKVFEWNHPQYCDNTGVSLPSPEYIECLPCGPGKVYKDNKCQYCPSGTFSQTDGLEDQCLACGPGTYALNQADFNEWSKFPEEFVPSCVTKFKQSCRYDWETRGTYITTSPVYFPESAIGIQGIFEAIEPNATVFFSFVVKGQKTKFSFYLNGKIVFNTVGEVKNETKIGVAQGTNSYKWVCFHVEEKGESCEIHRIVLEGSDVGGGKQCLQCPAGTVSIEGVCKKCPTGKTSNADRSECVKCEKNLFVGFDGNCKSCPLGFDVTDDQQACELKTETLKVENTSFLLKNFVATNENMTFYCAQQRLEMFCYETFYGPVQGGAHFFYLSVLSPSRVEMPSYEQVFEGEAYAFAVIDTKKIDAEQISMKKPQECEVESSQVVVNIGREVEEVYKWAESNKSGFGVRYGNGDLCKNEKRFSTIIQFVCDKEEQEGWPIFSKYDNCSFYFTWPTVHGCQVCTDDMIKRHAGSCKHGKRTSYNFEGENCVLGSSSQVMPQVENCESRVYSSWPFILSIVLSFGVLVAVVALIGLAWKTRRNINRLVQVRIDLGELGSKNFSGDSN